MEVKLCLEEMGLDLLGEVALGQEAVLVVGKGVEAEWEEHTPGLDPAETVFALIVEPRFPIKWGFPVII